MAFAINIENWRLVDEYDNYEISSHGRVCNNKTARILIPVFQSGYHCVNLYKDNVKQTRFID
jgi:hypothetical protein